jgi:hypothetical protein
MACCAALAIVLAFVRMVWARVLGRGPVEELFPPAAAWRSGSSMMRPTPSVPAAHKGTAIGRPLMVTVLAYILLIHLLAASGLAQVDPVGSVGWIVRDAVLAVVAFGLLLAGRRRVATAPALVGVGALWFALGVLDMHLFAGFEFDAIPLVLDTAFHLSGWWLAMAAAGVAVVQRRQETLLIGVTA